MGLFLLWGWAGEDTHGSPFQVQGDMVELEREGYQASVLRDLEELGTRCPPLCSAGFWEMPELSVSGSSGCLGGESSTG